MSNTLATTKLDAFMQKAAITIDASKPKLIFALDATASRSGTWRTAKALQKEMFAAAGASLAISIMYFRGTECQASDYMTRAEDTIALMDQINCIGGNTQFGAVLDHIIAEQAANKRIAAFVYISDTANEERENAIMSRINVLAGMTPKCPGFIFHERERLWEDAESIRLFQLYAKTSGGAYAPFDENAVETLKQLLSGVAAYASGGMSALLKRNDDGARLLLSQLKK